MAPMKNFLLLLIAIIIAVIVFGVVFKVLLFLFQCTVFVIIVYVIYRIFQRMS